ncbi:MAG: Hsp20/alpha crystallin family protein [Chitinispirillaceae bacterium]|nr:Hsp20/alpha crystallin family protein [Chitinispirillaceae bacterium]
MLWNLDVGREMERLRRDMDGLFSNYGRTAASATYPLVNVYEDKDKLTVTAELPGMTKEKVSITFSDGLLTIAGAQEAPAVVKNMSAVRRERTEGEFEKTINVPTTIDREKINASFSNGILIVTLPKAEEAKPKTISIEAK